jgi:hypothetical protein
MSKCIKKNKENQTIIFKIVGCSREFEIAFQNPIVHKESQYTLNFVSH